MRVPQARLNGAFIRKVDVTGSSGDYSVEIDPYLCGNTFELISVPLSSVRLACTAGMVVPCS